MVVIMTFTKKLAFCFVNQNHVCPKEIYILNLLYEINVICAVNASHILSQWFPLDNKDEITLIIFSKFVLLICTLYSFFFF